MTQFSLVRLGILVITAWVSANAESADSARRDAQTPASRTASAIGVSDEQSHIAADFVQERLTAWQQRLGLSGWQISIVMVHRSDLKPKTVGATYWEKDKKRATISVLQPAEYNLPFEEILNDLELTVVHELVHLNLAALPRSEASRSNEEQAVNRLAGALLGLAQQK